MFRRPAHIVVSLSISLWAMVGLAQAPMDPNAPFVPDDYLESSRRLDGDAITFCASSTSSLQDVDRAIANAIGVTQLLAVEWGTIRFPFPAPPYDFQIGLSAEALYEALNTECDVFTGVVLDDSTFPDWLTATGPYLETDYALVAPAGSVATLDELPAGARIGTRLGSGGDAVFAAFVGTLEEGRFRRIPYPDYRALTNVIAQVGVDAAVAWQPALGLAARDGIDLPDLVPLSGGPTLPGVDFGMIMLRENTFTRDLLDDAIAALAASGELAAILADNGF